MIGARFHWRLPQGGEGRGATRAGQFVRDSAALPDLARQSDFCQRASALGIDSLLVDFSYAKPEPLALALALACHSERVRFMIAVRSGIVSPALLVQQVNTFSCLASGRISLNVVAGYMPEEQRRYCDFLSHDERYARTAEFLEICRRFWRRDWPVDFEGVYYRVAGGKLNTPFIPLDAKGPEIYVGGGSDAARQLAIEQGDSWIRLADTPERIAASVRPVLEAGKQAALRLAIIARETRGEAVAAARALVHSAKAVSAASSDRSFVNRTDSVAFKQAYEIARTEWLTGCLWTGAVPAYGPTALALVGSPEDVAAALIEFEQAGISQFILSGWPKLEEMVYFGEALLPLVRARERTLAASAWGGT